MDTSETYIRMCEKAEELWRFRESAPGDFIVTDGKVYVLPSSKVRPDSIPLWRQDQLQEMILKHDKATPPAGLYLLERIWTYSMGEKSPVVTSEKFEVYSPEQFWLAFVMSQLYQKQWNGKEWV